MYGRLTGWLMALAWLAAYRHFLRAELLLVGLAMWGENKQNQQHCQQHGRIRTNASFQLTQAIWLQAVQKGFFFFSKLIAFCLLKADWIKIQLINNNKALSAALGSWLPTCQQHLVAVTFHWLQSVRASVNNAFSMDKPVTNYRKRGQVFGKRQSVLSMWYHMPEK